MTMPSCLLTLTKNIYFVRCLLQSDTKLKYPSTLWVMGISIYADPPPVLCPFLLFFAAYEMQQRTRYVDLFISRLVTLIL